MNQRSIKDYNSKERKEIKCSGGKWQYIRLALNHKEVDVAKAFIRHISNINAENEINLTLLHIAAKTGSFDQAWC